MRKVLVASCFLLALLGLVRVNPNLFLGWKPPKTKKEKPKKRKN
jgi:hypothetical protein